MDRYDAAIEYLTEQPDVQEAIFKAWKGPLIRANLGGCLFLFASYDGTCDDVDCGCLTQIRGGGEVAQTPELTKAIRADSRLPMSMEDIRPEHLPVFAEWQRRLDRELRQKKE